MGNLNVNASILYSHQSLFFADKDSFNQSYSSFKLSIYDKANAYAAYSRAYKRMSDAFSTLSSDYEKVGEYTTDYIYSMVNLEEVIVSQLKKNWGLEQSEEDAIESAQTVLTEIKKSNEEEDLPWWEKALLVAEDVGASVAAVGTSVATGILDAGESLVDTGAIIVGGVATAGAWVGDQFTGNDNAGDTWDGFMNFVATEHIKSAADYVYDSTAYGGWVTENAWGGNEEVFDIAKSVGEGVGYVAGIAAVSVLTGGVGSASSSVSVGASAVTSATKKTLSSVVSSGAKNFATTAAVTGFGRGTEEAWANGADTGEGLVYGGITAALDFGQYYLGAAVGGSNLSIAKKTMVDFGAGGADGVLRPLFSLVYKDSYIDELGNTVKFTDEDSTIDKYMNVFNEYGGVSGVLSNAAIGSGVGFLGEVISFKNPTVVRSADESIPSVITEDVGIITEDLNFITTSVPVTTHNLGGTDIYDNVSKINSLTEAGDNVVFNISEDQLLNSLSDYKQLVDRPNLLFNIDGLLTRLSDFENYNFYQVQDNYFSESIKFHMTNEFNNYSISNFNNISSTSFMNLIEKDPSIIKKSSVFNVMSKETLQNLSNIDNLDTSVKNIIDARIVDLNMPQKSFDLNSGNELNSEAIINAVNEGNKVTVNIDKFFDLKNQLTNGSSLIYHVAQLQNYNNIDFKIGNSPIIYKIEDLINLSINGVDSFKFSDDLRGELVSRFNSIDVTNLSKITDDDFNSIIKIDNNFFENEYLLNLLSKQDNYLPRLDTIRKFSTNNSFKNDIAFMLLCSNYFDNIPSTYTSKYGVDSYEYGTITNSSVSSFDLFSILNDKNKLKHYLIDYGKSRQDFNNMHYVDFIDALKDFVLKAKDFDLLVGDSLIYADSILNLDLGLVMEKFDWINNTFIANVSALTKNYFNKDKLYKLQNNCIFIDRNLHDILKEPAPDRALGYNNNIGSVIFVGSESKDEIIKSVISHESIHELSRKVEYDEFDNRTTYSGYYIFKSDKTVKYVGINESATEYINMLVLGENYPLNYCGYIKGSMGIKKILDLGIEGLDHDVFLSSYFKNDVDGFINPIIDFLPDNLKTKYGKEYIVSAFEKAAQPQYNYDDSDLLTLIKVLECCKI